MKYHQFMSLSMILQLNHHILCATKKMKRNKSQFDDVSPYCTNIIYRYHYKHIFYYIYLFIFFFG